jgi:hypothetical protein
MTRRILALGIALTGGFALTIADPSVATTATAEQASKHQFVLSGEGNRLWAYDARTGHSRLVVQARNPIGTSRATRPPSSGHRRDINGQICTSRDGHHIITGEDTVLPYRGKTGDSHDPRIAGWGYYRITGHSLKTLHVNELGKLAPAAGKGPGYTGDPDNYGCGFLGTRRLFTTAIGDTLPGEPAGGQLFLWFAPFTAGYHVAHDKDARFYVGRVDHCSIDDGLATAGGIAVDDNGDVYVATNRPDDNNQPGAVWRYRGRWPTSAAHCTKRYLKRHITKTRIIPQASAGPDPDPHAATPSAVVISPQDTLYVSSVFSGTIAEYTKGGIWVRDIYPESPVATPTGPTGQTPYGLAFTADGSLWIADLGIVGDDSAPDEGSVIRVRFDSTGTRDPTNATMRDGLQFPDGLGVYTVR